MSYRCHSCNAEYIVLPGQSVGRTESCSSCSADIHCCLNCIHYDSSAYNECRESQAERVTQKDRSNFCDYFSPASRDGAKAPGNDAKEDARKKLDDLFK